MFNRVLFASAFVVALTTHATQAQQIAIRESNLVIISPRTLSTNQADTFEEFKSNGRYFGAFYVSASGAFSWRSNLNTLDAAKQLSFLSCSMSNKNCQIYATLSPKPAWPAKPVEGLSRTAAESAERWLRETTVNGRSAAVAADGYFGWSGWQGKIEEARLRTSALNHCKDEQKARIDKLEQRQREALDQKGLLDCSIILIKTAR